MGASRNLQGILKFQKKICEFKHDGVQFYTVYLKRQCNWLFLVVRMNSLDASRHTLSGWLFYQDSNRKRDNRVFSYFT